MQSLVAPESYLALFVPFGVFFAADGLPQPYATILGALILYGSWAVGRVVANLWAALLPLIPWATAVALIYFAPEEGEVGRGAQQSSGVVSLCSSRAWSLRAS